MLKEKVTRKSILKPVVLLFLIAATGTIGYHLIEGWPFFDGLYMTVITLATVGYGETHELSQHGRIFTIFLILSSIGIVGYALSTLAAFIIEGELDRMLRGRKMDKRIASLKDHYVLCGAGHTGKAIAMEFFKTRHDFVVIDRNAESLKSLEELGDIPHIYGDATHDNILEASGIKRAKGLVSALSEDKDNVFVVLSARAMNPDLRIVSRIINDTNKEKIKKAGADEIVSPNSIGGMRMASVMLRPSVVNFLDAMLRVPDQTIRVDEFAVKERSCLVGQSLKEADIGSKTGLLLVAIKPATGGYVFNPPGKTKLNAQDILILIGTKDQLNLLNAF